MSNILQSHGDAVKEVHRLFEETGRLSKLVTYWHDMHDAEFELRQKLAREFEGMCEAHLTECGRSEEFRRALEKIALLDEADGHELARQHALEAVAIATSTLGKHPSEIYADMER